MSWVNLNDVYVNKTGDTIAGDLSVGGTLTINDGKGTDTTYNVANEITTLRDSVSQLPDWIKHKQITCMTSANGNMTFEGLDRKKTVVLFAVGIKDYVLIPYYQTPQRGMLGAHVVRDTASYSAITNTNVTADVYYFELP